MFPGWRIIFFGTTEDEKQTFCSWNTCSDSEGAPPLTPWSRISDNGRCSIMYEGMVCIQNTLEVVLYLGPKGYCHLAGTITESPWDQPTIFIGCSIRKIIVKIIRSMRMDPLPHFICCEINPLVNNCDLGKGRIMDEVYSLQKVVCRQ